MQDDTQETELTLTDDQIVTRRRALGLAAAVVGATALVAGPAYSNEDASAETNTDATEGDPDSNEDASAETNTDTTPSPDSVEEE